MHLAPVSVVMTSILLSIDYTRDWDIVPHMVSEITGTRGFVILSSEVKVEGQEPTLPEY